MNSEDSKLKSITDFVSDLQKKNEKIPLADPNTIIGQSTLVYAEQHEKVKRLLNDGLLNTSVLTARGRYLDNAMGNMFMVFRRGDTKAYVRCAFFGLPGTKLPKLTSVKNSLTGDIFELPDDSLLALEKSIQITFAPKNYNNVKFLIILNGARLDFEAKNDTEFAEQINRIFFNNQVVTVTKDELGYTLQSRNIIQTFSIDVSDNIKVSEMANNFRLNANEFGEKRSNIGDVNTLITAVPGVSKVYNFLAGVAGASRETDDEYRLRGLTSTYGKATTKAVKNALLNLEGVVSASCEENVELEEKDGIPGKSIAPIIMGGFDDEIAQTILDTKAGGIKSFGTTEVVIPNDSGELEKIGFSRPAVRQILVKIKIIPHAEETLSPSYRDEAIDEVFAYGRTLGVGIDVVPQRIQGRIANMEGVGEVEVECSFDGEVYTNKVLRISRFERAEFTKENISFE